MKFGHTLLAAQWGPWEDVYIPYKALKKILKEGNQSKSKFADTEGAFMTRLLHAIQSIDDFFESQVVLLAGRLAALRRSWDDPSAALTLMLSHEMTKAA